MDPLEEPEGIEGLTNLKLRKTFRWFCVQEPTSLTFAKHSKGHDLAFHSHGLPFHIVRIGKTGIAANFLIKIA